MQKDESTLCACKGGTLTRFLQPTLLSLLSEAPAHGYILVQKVRETALWQQNTPDAAGVYRVLRAMESRGLVKSQLTADSSTGMRKRVFSITPDGRACMANWLETLRTYRNGISDIITRLEQSIPPGSATSCCCGHDQT